MSTLDEFGDPDRSTRAGWLARTAHALPYVLVAYLVLCILIWTEMVDGTSGWLWVAIVPYLGVILISAAHRQLARLCLTCMQQVPADAPVRVRRYLSLLWLSHRAAGWWPFLLIIAWLGLTSAAYYVTGWEPGSASWLGAPVDLFVVTTLWAEWKHHRYRPWCPYCRRWDDGGGMREPSPDPVGDGTKVTS